MLPLPLVEYFHVLLGFTYVATLFSSHWNTLAARGTGNWAERAGLFELNRKLSLVFALPALIGTGILGNVMSTLMGYHMGTTRPLQIVTGLWVVLLLLLLAVDVPLTARLASQARSAANAADPGAPVGWQGTLDRWRIGNAVQLAVFLGLLWFMVAAWK